MPERNQRGRTERRLPKCLRVEVSNTGALARVLEKQGIEYKILSDISADIFAEISLSALAQALAEENAELRTAKERNESLESYYIDLIGGEKHA